MPSQHGVHCCLAGGRLRSGPRPTARSRSSARCRRSSPRRATSAGSQGKWHLGDNLHPQEGFTYWVTKPHGGTSEFYASPVIENGEVRKEPSYATDFWTERGIEFIEQNKDRPFFLFLAYNGPYGLGGRLADAARNRHAAYYADKQLPSFPREQAASLAATTTASYVSNLDAIRRYAAEISGIDDGVGEIMDDARENSGSTRTRWWSSPPTRALPAGTAASGAWATTPGRCTAFDGTMHVPLIFRHPAGIPAGRKSDLMVINYDFCPRCWPTWA